MFKSRLLLSLVALSVSFCVSLLTTRDFGKSLLTGSITLFASFVGAAVSEGRNRSALVQRTQELKYHIRALQRRRAETYDELVEMTEEREQLAHSIMSLQTQLRNMQAQTSTQKPTQSPTQSPTTWQRKEEVSWNLATPQPFARTSHTQDPQLRIRELEQKEVELNRSLSTTLAAKQRAELDLKATQTDLHQIQAQLSEQQTLKSELAEQVAMLLSQKQQLEAQLANLRPKVRDLEHYRSELNQFLASAEPKRQQVENSSRSLQGAIEQLQNQISSLHNELGLLETQIFDRRNQKEALDRELAILRAEAKGGSKEVNSSFNASVKSASLPTEWLTFLSGLGDSEFQALKAIVEHKKPNAALKQIAEAQLTMPELLIDAINEHAIDTIGDLLIEPSAGSSSPAIAPEYLPMVKQLIDLNVQANS